MSNARWKESLRDTDLFNSLLGANMDEESMKGSLHMMIQDYWGISLFSCWLDMSGICPI